MEIRAEKQYFDVTVDKVVEEKSPVKGFPLIVWHLVKEDGGRLYHRSAFTEAAKQVIMNDFRRAGYPLINGLEEGKKEIAGKKIRVCQDEYGNVSIIGRARS